MAPTDTPPCYRYRDSSTRNGMSSISKALMEGYRGYGDRDSFENEASPEGLNHQPKSSMHSDPEGIALSRHVDRQRHGGLSPQTNKENTANGRQHQAKPIELSRHVDRSRHGGQPVQGEVTPSQPTEPFAKPEQAAENPAVLRLFSNPPLIGLGQSAAASSTNLTPQIATSTNLTPQIGPYPSQQQLQVFPPLSTFPPSLSVDTKLSGSSSWRGSQNVVRQASDVVRQSSVQRQVSVGQQPHVESMVQRQVSVGQQPHVESMVQRQASVGPQPLVESMVHRQASVGKAATLDSIVQCAPSNKSAMDLQAAWERHGTQKPLRQVCMSARDTINTERGAMSPAPPLATPLSPQPLAATPHPSMPPPFTATPLPPMPPSLTSAPVILPPPVLAPPTPHTSFTPRRESSYCVPTLQRESNSYVAAGTSTPACARPPPQSASRGTSENFTRCQSATPRHGPSRRSFGATVTPPVSPMLGSSSPRPGGVRCCAPSLSTPSIVTRANSFQPRLSVNPPPGNGLTRELSSASTGALRVPSYCPSPRAEDNFPRSASLHSPAKVASLHSPAKVVRMRSVSSAVPTAASPSSVSAPVTANATPPATVMRKSLPGSGSSLSYPAKAPASRYAYDGFNLQETAAAIKAALQASAAAQRMLIQSGVKNEKVGAIDPPFSG